jgi:hypothetical protein
MVMSNFIDERERHAELYGLYTKRQHDVLELIKSVSSKTMNHDRLVESLRIQGITDTEISWLKRIGHVLPTYG